MARGTPPGPPNRPPSLGDLPPGFFGLMEPRPFKSITELIGTMANVLIAGEKAENDDFRDRFLQLYDTMHKGLALYIDQEFYSKQGNDRPVIIPMEMPDARVSVSGKPPVRINSEGDAYFTFGQGVSVGNTKIISTPVEKDPDQPEIE